MVKPMKKRHAIIREVEATIAKTKEAPLTYEAFLELHRGQRKSR